MNMSTTKRKILLGAVGCPGGIPTIKALQSYGFYVIGTDIKPNVVAAEFADKFYCTSKANSPDFLFDIRNIIDAERPVLYITPNISELQVLSANTDKLNTKLVSSEQSAINSVADKGIVYSKLKSNTKVKIPSYSICHSKNDLIFALRELLKFSNNAIIKPTDQKGSRGVRTVVTKVNRLTMDWQQWPNPTKIVPEEVMVNLDDLKYPVMVMEFIENAREYAVHAYCKDGEILTSYARVKEQVVHGLHSYHTVIERPDLQLQAVSIVKTFGLSCFVDIQFLDNKLLEVHPRHSTIIRTAEYDLLKLGVFHQLGEYSDEDLRQIKAPIGAMGKYYFDIYYDRLSKEHKEEGNGE